MLLVELAKQAVYRSEGAEALALAEEAREIYRSMGARAPSVEIANATEAIGYALKELNRADEGIKALDEAIALLREGGYPFVVDTLRTKANWCYDLHRYEDAIATYLEAIAINEINGEHEFFGKDLYWVAMCYQKLGRWSDAIVHAQKARNSLRENPNPLVDNIAWCDLCIADSYVELKNTEAAQPFAQRGYDIGTIRKNGALICKAAMILGKIQVTKGELEEAEKRFEEARNLVAGNDDWEMVQKIEKEFINLYLVQGKVGAAEEVERRLKSLQEVIE